MQTIFLNFFVPQDIFTEPIHSWLQMFHAGHRNMKTSGVGSSCVSHCLSFLQLQRKVITYKERSVFKSIKIIHSSHCCLFTLLPLSVELQCQFLSRSGQFFNQSAFNLRTSPLSYYLGFVGLQANTLANPAYGKWYHLSRTPGELRAKTESSLGLTEGDIFKAPTDIYLFLFLF